MFVVISHIDFFGFGFSTNYKTVYFLALILSSLLARLISFFMCYIKFGKRIKGTNSSMFVFHYIGLFSIDCSKTNTKVITLINNHRHRQSDEPIRARSKHM